MTASIIIDRELCVRKMQAHDIKSVVEIDNASFSSPWPRHIFEYELNHSPRAQCWVAEIAGVSAKIIVGAAILWLTFEQAHLGTLAVHPEHRKKGIAGQLLSTIFTSLIENGVQSMVLEVRKSNRAAQALYYKFGFFTTGELAGYYKETPEDALVMIQPDLQGWIARTKQPQSLF